MLWYKMIVACQQAEAEDVADMLLAYEASSVTFLDADGVPLLEPAPGVVTLWKHVFVQGLFETETARDAVLPVLNHMGLHDITFDILPEENWHIANQIYPPLVFADTLVVCAESAYFKDFPNYTHLLLPPGLGFGTGTHPTTALCLTWLAQHIRGGEVVMDYGCGSGILAIAALKLGAAHVMAVDYDPQALTATCDNAERNGIDASSSCLQVCLPDVVLPIVDIIVANILAAPLVALAPRFASILGDGGKIILSGILPEQYDLIAETYQQNGFQEIHCEEQDGWLCWRGRR